jgi:AraC family ethanolamine operon transcriptional activator
MTAAVLGRSQPSLFPSGHVVVRTASGQGLESVAAGWDVRYLQLDAGRCLSRHASFHTERMQLCLEAWSLGTLKVGRAPAGAVTFLVPAGRGCRIQGRAVAAGEVVMLSERDEFDYRSAGPSSLLSVSLERAALEALVRALLGRHLGELRLQGRLSGFRTDHRALRKLCSSLAARVALRPGLLRNRAFASRLERRLVQILFGRFDAPREAELPSRGRALARRAEAWLRQNLTEPPTIADLCAALHSSERTLHEAFREHLGATPKAYLKTLRLNAAHRDLASGRPGTRVTDVALDWGFVHFGWFSQDYRHLFGETPSQTLRRGRSGLLGGRDAIALGA